MKKKQVVTGWMIRTGIPINTDMSIDNTIDTNVYRGKGRKILFHPDDWPPIKVTLTAEWETGNDKE